MVYSLEDGKNDFKVEFEKGIYVVTGRAIERLVGRVNMEDNESMHFFQKILKNLGVEEKLKEMGVEEGDTVKFADYELEWYD